MNIEANPINTVDRSAFLDPCRCGTTHAFQKCISRMKPQAFKALTYLSGIPPYGSGKYAKKMIQCGYSLLSVVLPALDNRGFAMRRSEVHISEASPDMG